MRKLIKQIENFLEKFNKLVLNIGFLLEFKTNSNKYGLNKEHRDRQIIVSLTSFPARIDKVYLCVQSILLQSMRPDKIIIYLGVDEFQNVALPDNLTNLFKYGVEVRFRKDLKPHTKYFYAMQEFKNSLVITVDDDIFYRKNLIRDLYNAYQNHPDCVICTRAHKMIVKDGKLLPYNSWDFESTYFEKESDLLFATGVGGVLYDPLKFCNETFNENNIITLSLKQDDVWLKFMEIISGIKVYTIFSHKNKYLVGIWNSEKITLNSQNVGQSKNDIYINNVVNEYDIDVSSLK